MQQLSFDDAEMWLPAVGWEGIYEVSDLGRVRSVPRINSRGWRERGRIRKPSADGSGYYQISLWSNNRGRNKHVHVLVAEAFYGPRPVGMEVRHLDGDRRNNVASNLRWGTDSENKMDTVLHGTHRYSRRTHCDNNHEFTPDNTSIRSDGGRRCKTCKRTATNRRRHAASAARRKERAEAA